MCLVVRKKYESNDIQRIAYKILSNTRGSFFYKDLKTPYTHTCPYKNKIVAIGEIKYVRYDPYPLLERGAIHCFSDLQSARRALATIDRTAIETLHIFSVLGTNIIAEGDWDTLESGYRSIAFKEIELISEIL